MSATNRVALRKSAQGSRLPAPDVSKGRSTAIAVPAKTQCEVHAAVAKTLMRPEVGAASAIEVWQPETHDVNALASELSAQIEAVNRGDLSRAEGMLTSQAHTLNDVFNILLRKATAKMPLQQWEAYMRMAMRAQSQCRMTLEALAEIKNPKAIAFVQQANIAHGAQQVNNGAAPTRRRASETEAAPNELSGDSYELLSDTETSPAAGGANQGLGALETVNRASNRGGQG